MNAPLTKSPPVAAPLAGLSILKQNLARLNGSAAPVAPQAAPVAVGRIFHNDAPHVGLRCAADIEPEPIHWLWENWLAKGKLHILAGAPGTGKSTLAFALAATITRGGRWPDGSQAQKGYVIIWSGEDDPRDTIVPRLLACGADVNRVHIVEGTFKADGVRAFDPSEDVALLQDTIRRRGINKPALLIVDSVVSAVAGDSHKNTETRRGLQPLVDLAQAEGCALLGISHFSKGTAGRDVVERVTGSLAFGALARVVLATAKMPAEQGGGRMLAIAKSNIGPDSGGFEYELQQHPLSDRPEIIATSLRWGKAFDGSAKEILAMAECAGDPEDVSALDGAKDFLRQLLASGPIASEDIKQQAKGAGLTWRTIRRAKDALGIKPQKAGMLGPWMWGLLPKMSKNTEDAQL